MSREYNEIIVESAVCETLGSLGWRVVSNAKRQNFQDDPRLKRENMSEVILKTHLLRALKRLNPDLPESALLDGIAQLAQGDATKSLARINQEKYALMKGELLVSYRDAKGQVTQSKLRVFDFANPLENEFMAVQQMTVTGELYNRRPDIIGFVNGIPLVFFEVKSSSKDVRAAYDANFNDYKRAIPHLFHCNAFVVLSNGLDAKVGTITSPFQFFQDWKRITEDEEGVVSLDTLLRGTCSPANLMDIFENFLLFDNSGGNIVKIMAKNHQFIGVNKVIGQARHIEDLKGKLGVFWHTQGSGKSYSMVFIAEKILRKLGGAYTFLIVSDRSELERQLYDTFTGVGAVKDTDAVKDKGSKKNKSVVAKSREELRTLLQDNHRYVFTLIHKFSYDPAKESAYPLITERRNIIVISDEAHRTQSGTFARNMRFHGIPNASYLGFTGTPIIKDEAELTKNIFGEYVSVYDFQRAVDDGATVPLRYLNRGEQLGIANPSIDREMLEVLGQEELEEDQRLKLAYLFKKDYVVLTAMPRLEAVARDLVWHFNERGYQGKAMLVTLDKPTAVKMYDLIMRFWADYVKELMGRIARAEDDQAQQALRLKLAKVEATEVCVVVSQEQNEVDKFEKLELDIAPHRRKMVERDLERDFKDDTHNFRLAIVCAMWITGFDAPCVSTVYLDKPIQGHTLMQTIARANRVYDDEKENGLIVDYGNAYKRLEEAYAVYGPGSGRSGGPTTGTEGTGGLIDKLEEMEVELKAAIATTTVYLHELGFDLSSLLGEHIAPMAKLALLRQAMDAVCLHEQSRATFEVHARMVFRKYQALYPEPCAKAHTRAFNAIEAIYQALNQQVRQADVTDIIYRLQSIVDRSITVSSLGDGGGVEIDLSWLDMGKLRLAFANSQHKNTITYELAQLIEAKLDAMLRQNPMRYNFKERYEEIIAEYNQGKTLEDTEHTFEQLSDYLATMSEEDQRAMREGLDEDTLAIFDLLSKDKDLSATERKEVKSVAAKTLAALKAEMLRIERWRDSRETSAKVMTIIRDQLEHLPDPTYNQLDLNGKASDLFAHLYGAFPNGWKEVG